jgi:hypothetical protein
MPSLKKTLFRTLARLNKIVLPKYSRKDLTKISKFDKLIIAYRY